MFSKRYVCSHSHSPIPSFLGPFGKADSVCRPHFSQRVARIPPLVQEFPLRRMGFPVGRARTRSFFFFPFASLSHYFLLISPFGLELIFFAAGLLRPGFPSFCGTSFRSRTRSFPFSPRSAGPRLFLRVKAISSLPLAVDDSLEFFKLP